VFISTLVSSLRYTSVLEVCVERCVCGAMSQRRGGLAAAIGCSSLTWAALPFLGVPNGAVNSTRLREREIRARAWSTTHRTHTHSHTHTHRHVGFYGLRGLPIGVMVLYCTNCMCYCPTPKLSPHRRRCIFTFPPKTHSV